jgi:hypothetical protein
MSEQENENKDVENSIEDTPVEEPTEIEDNKGSKQYGSFKAVGPLVNPTGVNAVKKLKSFLKGDRGY